MSKPFKHVMDGHASPPPFGVNRLRKSRVRASRRFRVIPYDDMTVTQKRICEAAVRPGTPVPTDLSGDELVAWFVARAVAKVSAS
ncbi:hypothetical protein [Azospirillum sp.]|uniref:hypothetical protein n=1 Tax=Azospirillum sp. TaxID=34012 RepID=UPI00261F9EF5|nr:hypothetical protein [Azospirillum sp.]